ncbi:DUF1259 domain-containing protein [Bacillus velezensis]|uniref:DUF1259 domain-containing protein n=1 Tax=Bacillus amyloliquefaciens group TaxID=1938374 RepID=UPI001A9A13D7|nr:MULTISPECIES: DUF1259 domain-containing protein [Bacillus amyloliquefaciens group]UXZ17953.1 DUF1259 domain-containing protein [Bacillus siamensis]MBY6039655.1 DUF1259 domain-containing protein [Bacillus velezensis]MCA1239026.1 DUF1259 domain-containing protein [Bacillus velezensis]QSZ46726.1 DUF1259 domain-containing protein [Bacillus amyloliquefaciens]WFR92118.1 DUF1259 domain-containing protein [Bacillus velezensis]
MEETSMEPSRLCKEFARILNSTPSVVNGVCTATRFRSNIHPVVLGRRAEAFPFIPQAFSFESMDSEGRALCLGETVLLQEEVNPLMSELRKFGIIVTAVHNHWLFDKPRLMFMHFESIDKPLNFARKVREALRVLTTKTVRAVPKTDGEMIERHGLCDEFNDILGGTMHTFENGICTVMRSRTNIKPVVLGRPGRSFLLIPQMFSFESMIKDGRALCSGETVILQKEINPFISALRKHDLIVTSLHNHWLFDKPRLMYIHFEAIDKPVNFALKVRNALKVLTDKEVEG